MEMMATIVKYGGGSAQMAWFYPARRKLVSCLVLIAVPLLTSSYFL